MEDNNKCPICNQPVEDIKCKKGSLVKGICDRETCKSAYDGEPLKLVQCVSCKDWGLDDDEDNDFRCGECCGSFCQCCWFEQTSDYPAFWDDNDQACKTCRETLGIHKFGNCVSCSATIVLDDDNNGECGKCKEKICLDCCDVLMSDEETDEKICMPCGGKKKEKKRKWWQ